MWYIWGFRYADRRAPTSEDYDRSAYLPMPCEDDDLLTELLEYWSLPGDWDVTSDCEGLQIVAKIRHRKSAGSKRTICHTPQYYKLIKTTSPIF